MFIRKLFLNIILLGLLIFSCVPVLGETDQSGNVLSESDLQRFTTVIDNVKKYYYKSVDSDSLVTRAISGMLSSLDPHSEYLNKEALTDLEVLTWGKFGGIGVEVVSDQGLIRVVSPLDGTPADKAGIKSGDYIVQINNKLVRDMTPRDAVGMMRGKKGTFVRITIIRKNEEKPLVFNLRREMIKLKGVKERLLEPGYGYIRLAVFQEPTGRDMNEAINRLQKKSPKGGLKGLILDMRNNPGGLVDSAVEVADRFLDADSLKNNDLIVYAKGQGDKELMSAKATSGDLLPKIPIVVIINEGSASASEIVAGALQDHKRAIVVGTQSFGKGSMQTVIPIDKTSAIKLTTALYFTPLGKSIQAKGITPDINVENMQFSKDKEQNIPRVDEAALVDHIENGDDVSNGTNATKNMDKQGKQSKEELELAYKDYQLYEALHILKSQNIARY